jgi:hypothetical protein
MGLPGAEASARVWCMPCYGSTMGSRVTCPCGWSREASSEWAANAVSRLHQQLADVSMKHVTEVEGPGHHQTGEQLRLEWESGSAMKPCRGQCLSARVLPAPGYSYDFLSLLYDSVSFLDCQTRLHDVSARGV